MGDGFFYKLKTMIGIEEIDEEDHPEEIPGASSSQERKPMDSRGSYSPVRNEVKDIKESKDNRVLPIQNKSINQNTNQFKLVVIEPKSFDECPKLVDNLKARKPVIINLEKVETDTARKIFDFLSGATYAVNGNVQKVANNIFIFAPENVDVSASVDQKNIDFSGAPKNIWR
ncbi:MAG: cell division protein SepF [Eubacteriales bacterium]|nr:cell division protein SepF [Eubacteriales bacterium]MDD3198926.1 cell division protein SepF [Eubacteriales bacterium]MDD4121483.1 cell division protein SepF [Eubacteriales bacterium]MDD4629587.1 cell division protein SepF [Eubacteriales bacterium]